MEDLSKYKSITELIKDSDVALVNKLSQSEVRELADLVESWLVQHAESVEGMFDIDSEEEILAYRIPDSK